MHSVNTRPSRRCRLSAPARIVAALAAVGLLGTACGSDEKGSSPATATVQETAAPDTVAESVAETVPAATAATVAETIADTAPVDTLADGGPINLTGDSVEQAADYTDYVKVTDDSGTLTIEVPVQWADVRTSAIDNNGVAYPRIEASTDLTKFNSGFGVPGVRFLSVPIPNSNFDELLDVFSVDGCTDGGITEFNDGTFVGKFQLWKGCAGTSAIYLVLVTNLVGNTDNAYVTTVQAVTSADVDALDHILKTFSIG